MDSDRAKPADVTPPAPDPPPLSTDADGGRSVVSGPGVGVESGPVARVAVPSPVAAEAAPSVEDAGLAVPSVAPPPVVGLSSAACRVVATRSGSVVPIDSEPKPPAARVCAVASRSVEAAAVPLDADSEIPASVTAPGVAVGCGAATDSAGSVGGADDGPDSDGVAGTVPIRVVAAALALS